MKSHEHHSHADHAQAKGPYLRLAIMAALSFVAMYALMYAMVDAFANVYNSLNQAYMAGLMAAPMTLIELALMRSMYPRKALNGVLVVASIFVMLLCWYGIRKQAAISDQQFLRSMIPHHAGALLMCRENRLTNPDLRRLCREILASQQSEIDLMRSKLR
ncbi:MAG TPA: DUF305 domain-containing protein [Pseudoxanthomonas sp.]|nr:DUF305 domain-containing protein [Pseudoxanthomonas sp.]